MPQWKIRNLIGAYLVLGAEIDERTARDLAKARRDDVGGDAEMHQKTLALAIFGQQTDARVIELAVTPSKHRAFDLDLAGVKRHSARMAWTSSVLPEPTRPARPTTSPPRSVKDTFFTRLATLIPSARRRIGASWRSGRRGGKTSDRARPTINEIS